MNTTIPQSDFFESDLLFSNVYRIKGLGGELAYLIEGRERALLIDGLCGVGSLKTYVENMTDKPVTLVLTHAHLDHNGAAWEFGECYLHPYDIPLLYEKGHSGIDGRFAFAAQSEAVKAGRVTREDTVPPCAVKTYPVYDGDAFDLGGTVIEAISVCGHTFGSLVFLDRERRVAYSGDACNIMTLIGLTGCASVEEYQDGLLNFKAYQPYFDVCYGGHGFYPVPNTAIDEALALCREILAGRDARVKIAGMFGVDTTYLAAKPGENHKTATGGDVNILYMDEGIRKRPRPVIRDVPNLYK